MYNIICSKLLLHVCTQPSELPTHHNLSPVRVVSDPRKKINREGNGGMKLAEDAQESPVEDPSVVNSNFSHFLHVLNACFIKLVLFLFFFTGESC